MAKQISDSFITGRNALGFHELGSRAADRAISDKRAHCHYFFVSESFSNTGQSQDGANARDGIAGPYKNRILFLQQGQKSKARKSLLQSCEHNRANIRLAMPAYPEVLKVHYPFRGGDNSRNDIVRHGDHLLLHSHCPGQGLCGQTQFDATTEQIGAKDVRGPILVSYYELFIHAKG